jgi:N-acetylglucosaminyldiphosphoundecaprenol N-acetyl-beta-D-mannosaminyltransferase
MKVLGERLGARIMGAYVDALSWEETLARISNWAVTRQSRYVCLCNVHSLATASEDSRFRQAVNGADLAVADGMPVALALRLAGFRGQPRISGPDLFWKYCSLAAGAGQSIFLYGSTPQTIERLTARLGSAFPDLRIAGAFSPPFRPLTADEDDAIIRMIDDSGANVVFVGLGCPKQELWMAAQRGKIMAVLLGVGAAFDFHAGTLKRAPLWMQRYGVEWLHRLASEPGRLWRRYLVSNSKFLFHMAVHRTSREARERRSA